MDEATIYAPADRLEKVTGHSNEVRRTGTYRPDVDGLRSLAILSVVLYHAGVGRIAGGFTGVDVFFVISGYLIGGHINSELAAHNFRFSNFYRNRAKRILPALYVVLTALLVVGLVLFSPRELRDLAMYTISTIASASNVALWRNTNYFAQSSDQYPLLMTWSLGVEEQFYLVIPLLLVLLSKIRHRLILPVIVLMTVASFTMACYQVNHRPDSAFYLTDSRAWEMGVGVALAMFEAESRRFSMARSSLARNLRSWVGICLMVAPFCLLNSSVRFPGLFALPSVFGTALLLSSSGGWVNRRLLALSPLVFIGRVSYSFYLIHWPILAVLRVLRGGTFPESWGLTAVFIAFGLAVLSYYFVEIPFRSSKRPAGALLLRYGGISALLLFCSAIIFTTRGVPWRYRQAASVDSIASRVSNTEHDACLAQGQEAAPRLSLACTGSQTQGEHIALWGDSHASAVAKELQIASERQQYFLEKYEKTSCPPLFGLGRAYRQNPSSVSDCIEFNTAVLQRIVNEPQVKIVILDAFWDAAFDPHTENGKLLTATGDTTKPPTQAESEELFRSSLSATLKTLVDAHKTVVVLGDTPVFETDPVWRMRTGSIPLRRQIVQTMLGASYAIDPGADLAVDATRPQQAAWDILRQTALSLPGVTYWDMRKNLCNAPSLCAYRQGDTPLFVDTNHVSPEGAMRALNGWELPTPRAAVATANHEAQPPQGSRSKV